MGTPASALSSRRNDLFDSLQEFDLAANEGGFIATRVMPVFEAAKASGNFGIIPVEQLLQEREVLRAAGSGYSRGKWQFEPATYSTQEYGAEEPVDDNNATNYRDYFDAEMVAAARARSALLVGLEMRAADLLFNATTWNGASLTTGITNEWDKNHTSDAVPIDDVEAAVNKVYDGSGLWPNALIINRKVFRNLRNLDQITERIQSAGAGAPTKPSDITAQMLAMCFDLKYVLVAGGTKNSANEGQALSAAQIWSSEYAMVARIAETNDIAEPCVGRHFHWSEDGSTIEGTVEDYREEQTRSNIIRNRHQVGSKVLYVQAAHLLSNVTTL